MRNLLLLFVTACGVPDAALPDHELAPPASIVLTGPARLVVGRVNTFTVTGNLGQQEPVYLALSTAGPGASCPPTLGGTCLSILAPQLADQARFDGEAALLEVFVPAGAPVGVTLGFQAGVIRGARGNASVVSNAINLTTEPAVLGCTDADAENYAPVATVDDGSCTYTVNPPGTVLIPSSDWLDPNPPAGWSQCGGFVNTTGDDVTTNVLDNCLNTTSLRMRVWDDADVLVDDVYATDIIPEAAWPDFSYLGGNPIVVLDTWWQSTTTFFISLGGDACTFGGQNNGFSLGNGHSGTLNISPADFDVAKEIRLNCGGAGLIDYKVALYR